MHGDIRAAIRCKSPGLQIAAPLKLAGGTEAGYARRIRHHSSNLIADIRQRPPFPVPSR